MDVWWNNHFLCKDLVHPIETTNKKWLFRVPGGASKTHRFVGAKSVHRVFFSPFHAFKKAKQHVTSKHRPPLKPHILNVKFGWLSPETWRMRCFPHHQTKTEGINALTLLALILERTEDVTNLHPRSLHSCVRFVRFFLLLDFGAYFCGPLFFGSWTFMRTVVGISVRGFGETFVLLLLQIKCFLVSFVDALLCALRFVHAFFL